MIKLSKKDLISVSRRAAYILSLCDMNDDIRTLLSKTCCEFMSDNMFLQGETIADEVLCMTAAFQCHFEAAQESPQVYTQCQIQAALELLPLEEQCRMLYQTIRMLRLITPETAAEALQCDSRKDFIEDFTRRLGSDAYTGPASMTARDRMLSETADEIGRTALVLSESQFKWMQKIDDASEAALKMKLDQDFVAVVTAMCVYSLALNGMQDENEPNLTLRQAVVFACESAQMNQLYQACQRNEISHQHLLSWLKPLWIAVIVVLLSSQAGLFDLKGSLLAAGGILVGIGIFALSMCRQIRAAMVRMLQSDETQLSPVHLNTEELYAELTDAMDRWTRFSAQAVRETAHTRSDEAATQWDVEEAEPLLH